MAERKEDKITNVAVDGGKSQKVACYEGEGAEKINRGV